MKFEKDETFFLGRFKSIGFAFKGAVKLITTEHSVMVQFLIAVLLIIAGFYFNITKEEWMFQTLTTGLVLGVEGLNTAVEKVADFIHPDYHKKIGFIKDIAAGAVFFAAMTGIAIGSLIYIPYFFN
ncbi:diacylglycerol kinase family protein [uncultured Flavobacterium sp.]|uniref:diacylglycerol kinase n=1 Tax=uncultured Flavobacterium sp. TaxID=165435 RepID=UPI0030CA1802|tara:strand:+ start:117 stop:494 length:378 start_codon:yes stop_codon:yes gene_type:complete